MSLALYVVDAFADGPFTGNPAAVCLLDAPRPDAWMQAVAAEMRHSETAFLLPEADAWRLRWMTPAAEVDLCGHATLASAHVLFSEGFARRDAPIRFHTRSGELRARSDGDHELVLDFPATQAVPGTPDPGLVAALGVRPVAFGETSFQRLVEVATEREVRAAAPDFRALAAAWDGLVVLTARSQEPEFDFVSRSFAPGKGIDEDPVTGSAHCVLGPWWGARLAKTSLAGRQVSQRGGTVRVRLAGDRAHLAGRAVTVVRGALSA